MQANTSHANGSSDKTFAEHEEHSLQVAVFITLRVMSEYSDIF